MANDVQFGVNYCLEDGRDLESVFVRGNSVGDVEFGFISVEGIDLGSFFKPGRSVIQTNLIAMNGTDIGDMLQARDDIKRDMIDFTVHCTSENAEMIKVRLHLKDLLTKGREGIELFINGNCAARGVTHCFNTTNKLYLWPEIARRRGWTEEMVWMAFSQLPHRRLTPAVWEKLPRECPPEFYQIMRSRIDGTSGWVSYGAGQGPHGYEWVWGPSPNWKEDPIPPEAVAEEYRFYVEAEVISVQTNALAYALGGLEAKRKATVSGLSWYGDDVNRVAKKDYEDPVLRPEEEVAGNEVDILVNHIYDEDPVIEFEYKSVADGSARARFRVSISFY